MDKSKDNELEFSFARLASANNYKKWAWEMWYFFKSGEL